jgi:hypothetical protein
VRRLGRALGELVPAALAGAFFVLCTVRVGEPAQNRLVLLVLGGLYGVSVLGLLRAFRVAPFGLPWAGLLAGPVPVALLMTEEWSQDDRGGALFLAALLGVLIGVLEWARIRRAARGEAGRSGPYERADPPESA